MTGEGIWFKAALDNAVLLNALRRVVNAANDDELGEATSAAARLLDKEHAGEGFLDTLQAASDLAERATTAAETLKARLSATEASADALRARCDEVAASLAQRIADIEDAEATIARLQGENDSLRAVIACVPSDLQKAATERTRLGNEITRLNGEVTRWFTRARALEAELATWDRRYQECDALNARLVEERNAVEAERDREQAEARRLAAEANRLEAALDAVRREVSGLPKPPAVGGPVQPDVFVGERPASSKVELKLGTWYTAAPPIADILRFHGAIAPNVELQRLVWQRVVDRGYAAGYSNEQLVARQLTKLVEEVAEACACVVLDVPRPGVGFDTQMYLMGELARARFNERDWEACEPEPLSFGCLEAELYDCQVVLCALASVLGELAGHPIDLLRGALDKAAGDVARGVRSTQNDASSDG